MKDSNRLFYVINEEGIRQEAEILAKFKLPNNLNYITYTYGEINDNDMIKIYSTGIDGQKGNYNYREIGTTTEWDGIKDILKLLAKDETKELPIENSSDLKIVGEEISVRKPKKLFVSNKFAKTVAEKYVETNEGTSQSLNMPSVDEVTQFKLPVIDPVTEEPKVVPEPEPVHSKITVPSFEELQARTKKVDEVRDSVKPEDILQTESPKVKKEDYTEKFKSEVEPVLLDVYSRQQAQIDALEEELSKTKYDLFEEQKLSLSLKSANKELTEKGNQLESELEEAKSKVNGIMNLLQGSK